MGEMADYYMEREWQDEFEHSSFLENVEECFQADVWITSEYKEIALSEMQDSHLLNAINYIKRGGEVFGYADQWLPKLEKELSRR